MTNLSYFESRSGNLTCNIEEVFAFVTDIRNFEQFIPNGNVNYWKAEKESCSFSVSMLGSVNVRLTEKEESNKVIFKGDALGKNNFTLTLNISKNTKNQAVVTVMLSADLNPMMKMMVSKPIDQFLGILINEMEKFRGWNNTKE
jgi:carbon monoxide dehydrogenase subunit G